MPPANILPNFVFVFEFLPHFVFVFLPQFFCISSSFCLCISSSFCFCISSQFEAPGCQRCKADGSFPSHWEEIQDQQIIKSQTPKLVPEEGFPQDGAALADSSLLYFLYLYLYFLFFRFAFPRLWNWFLRRVFPKMVLL